MIDLTRRSFVLSGAMTALAIPCHTSGKIPETIGHVVSSILTSAIDKSYLQSKLSLDALIAPTPLSIGREIAVLADAARQMAGPSPTDPYKVAAIRKAIYDSGPWNGNRPFSYDQADPLGMIVENKLLATYLATRLGNCVSMPALFMILAEQTGLNASFVTAPLHVFVRFTHPERGPTNLEPTSGAHVARDEWYRTTMPITDRAIESGLYMRALTKSEGVALLATTVLEYLDRENRQQDIVEVADVILQANPRDALTMVKKGTAFGKMMQAEFTNKYPTVESIPATLHQRYQMLADLNRKAFEDAENLGWQPIE
ncbi:transglutaminase family protein [Sphingobium sp. HBC34]|uniref:Transglutaminase family protein n=1 Tax=Sphingobium cyanobacteriorum TaxID=3063954 RepID=A0ABT8ZMW5_9SPHN|nr:transglutaminase family protein [Sphingobium sp. HBC34]MDO7835758.1 transglutaminase family protein [Sphingobium sp. HBC34]